MIAVSQPDPAFYKNISGLFLVFSIFLVILTIIFGNEINGAKRWLDLGFFTLQPSELVKIALPIFLASYLYDKSLPINLRHTFISILVIQDGTGSRTVSWNAAYEFAADTSPTLTTTANLGDLFVFRYNGAKWLEVGRNLALTLS